VRLLSGGGASMQPLGGMTIAKINGWMDGWMDVLFILVWSS